VFALAVAAAGAVPAGATTLIRASLEHLVATNGTIVVGDVVDTDSHWNEEGTFILTDVRVAPREVLKGKLENGEGELALTLLGGSVDGKTALIVGGADLRPGKSYVLFVDDQPLPGVARARTIRDHCQGVFEIVKGQRGLGSRAVSQAAGHPLLPDVSGQADAAGGMEGFTLQALKDSIRKIAGEQAGPQR